MSLFDEKDGGSHREDYSEGRRRDEEIFLAASNGQVKMQRVAIPIFLVISLKWTPSFRLLLVFCNFTILYEYGYIFFATFSRFYSVHRGFVF